MAKYIAKRLLMLIPVLLGVSIIVFVLLRVFAADPSGVVLGEHATDAAKQAWRDTQGLNDPIWLQYWNFISGAVVGNFGQSYYTKTDVSTEIFSRFPATAELAVVAIIIASVLGILIGVITAVKKNTIIDNAGMVLSIIGISIPIFWLGVIFQIVFAKDLGWLPVQGATSSDVIFDKVTGSYIIDSIISGKGSNITDVLWHMVMPAFTLAIYTMAVIARMTRSSMLDTLNQDYIRTARAKGISEGKVIKKHALRNALMPIVTVIGLQFGSLLGGAVLTESVYGWPGIGKYLVECVQKSDFPVVQAAVLLIAVIFVVLNLIVDIIYAFLDPRIKYGKKEA